VDDHLVHRGDGVFETLKCSGGALYQLDAHLKRLRASANAIGIAPPWDDQELTAIVLTTVREGGRMDCLVRVLVSRGPGGFGVDPRESREPQLYVATYAAQSQFMARFPGGAKVGISSIPAKPGPLVTIKTCNYLPNVLMKKEANERGLHFIVCLDSDGFITESFTENMLILTRDGRVVSPLDTQMLPGTTLQRVLAYAREEVAAGRLTAVAHEKLRPADVAAAAEVWIAGTTAHLTSVVEFDGTAIGDGKPGLVWARLAPRLDAEIAGDPVFRTPVGF
jgi:branched-chain amino acid aminotransferase